MDVPAHFRAPTFSGHGITIAYDDTNSGEPLVLIHGHPFDRSMWQPQREHFGRRGWRVIAPDLRGYGETTVVPAPVRWEEFVHDIVGLLDSLSIQQIVLGGLSMGGQIVMEFHRLYPHRLRALVLADTSPRAETPGGRRGRHEVADRLLREGMDPYAHELLPMMIRPENIRDEPGLASRVLRMMRGTAPEGAAAALRARADRPDYVEMLGRVAVPTLIVVGRHDAFTPLGEAQLMEAGIARATLAIIDEAGHMPNLERPAAFNAALEAFLDTLRRDQRPDGTA
jgi:pimeloyl-ACP methyl ester carboxylesterase